MIQRCCGWLLLYQNNGRWCTNKISWICCLLFLVLSQGRSSVSTTTTTTTTTLAYQQPLWNLVTTTTTTRLHTKQPQPQQQQQGTSWRTTTGDSNTQRCSDMNHRARQNRQQQPQQRQACCSSPLFLHSPNQCHHHHDVVEQKEQQPVQRRRRSMWRLWARRPSSSTQTEQEEESLLSELDARVLRSMLQDQDKLELDQEENMRRLLERGVGPKTAPKPDDNNDNNNDNNNSSSEYSSQLFQKLTDTKLWRVLKRTTEDLVESAKIFVINRMERDAKLLASVGLFAWDRAVRDVARALPAASSTVRVAAARLLLTSNSSINTDNNNNNNDQQQPVDLFEEWNTPLDEIKSVTQALTDILSGDVSLVDGGTSDFWGGSTATSSSSRRRLRTLAPAGQGSNAERQRRAYERRKRTTLQEEKQVVPNIGKVVTDLADVTWEMQRELQVETSPPGYKTEPIRNAVEAGASQTGRLLQSVKEDGWTRALLSPLKRQKLQRQLKAAAEQQQLSLASSSSSNSAGTIPVDVLLNLTEERDRVMIRLKRCIEQPEATWLNINVVKRAADGVQHFDEQNLRQVVESMIQARDDIKAMIKSSSSNSSNKKKKNAISISGIFDDLYQVKESIEQIQIKASQLISPVVGNALFDELVGKHGGDATIILLSLEELEDVILGNEQPQQQLAQDFPPRLQESAMSSRATATTAASNQKDTSQRSSSKAEKATTTIVDVVIPKDDHRPAKRKGFWNSKRSDDGDAMDTFSVEVVNDVDSRTVEAVAEDLEDDDEEGSQEKPNIFIQMTLRSLDVVFFVIEKVVLVAVPKLFRVGGTMSKRIDEVGRSGLGRKGWQRIGYTNDGAKRY